MNRPALIHPGDLSGAIHLATDAVTGLTSLVEAVHARVARRPGSLTPQTVAGYTTGISRLVYQSVRGLTRLAGHGAADVLHQLSRPSGSAASVPQRDALLAALNGVLGDHLEATGNPLATRMTLHTEARVLGLPVQPLQTDSVQPGRHLLLMIHGLCMDPMHWNRAGHNHGDALGLALKLQPAWLRYNSGLHVSSNGRALAELLEHHHQARTLPLRRLVILGHSMGGLIARSAVHHAVRAGHQWPRALTDLICLGTPHHGAPLERAGHRVDTLLGRLPYVAPFAKLGKLRSAGITDLRHGSLLDSDWQDHDRFTQWQDPRTPVALPPGVRCFAMAATLKPLSQAASDHWLGDGLVPLDSALGRHPDPRRQLTFSPNRQWIGERLGHLDLLSDPRAFKQLLSWLEPNHSRKPAR